MIKINLLKALKESTINTGEREPMAPESQSFFAKLFAPQKSSEELSQDFDDAKPINPIVLLVKVIIMLMFIIGLFVYESINIPKLQNQLEQENMKLQQLTEYNNKAALAVAEIKKQQEHKNLIERQIASLDGLSKVRLKYIRVLDLIQTNLPEKLWFTSLKSKDNTLEVSGLAFSEDEITNFLNVMGKSIYFSDVSMLSSEDVIAGRDANQRKFKKFNINFTLEDKK